MSRSNIQHVRTWSRSCDVAVHVYRVLGDLRDRQFADRVIQNAFTIPEGVATALTSSRFASRHEALARSLEALVVLQTQLYLACECGLLAIDQMSAICAQAADLSVELRSEHEAEGSASVG